jgi:L-fuconolactonase
MVDFPLFDPHVHLWDRSRFSYPWLAEVPPLDRDCLLPDYWAACGSVEVGELLFMQCDCVPEQGLAEAVWAASLAADDPRLVGVVAFAPIEQGDRVAGYLDRLQADCGLLRGVRRLIQGEPDPDFCLQPAFVAGVKRLAGYDLPFDLCATAAQLPAVIELARQVPEVQLVVDHIGKPDIAGGGFAPWAQGMAELASMDHVVCKLSSLATEADHQHWTRDALQPYVSHVVEHFGVNRCLFASDWPVCTLAADLPTCVETLDVLLAGASQAERRAIFRENGLRVYGLADRAASDKASKQ